MLRELRVRRQVSKRAVSALENVLLTILLMTCIVSVPVFVALLGAVIH